MMRLQGWLPGLALFLVTGATAVAGPKEPEEVVRHASEQVIETIEANAESLREDPERSASLVEELILPRVDLRRMAAEALGERRRCASKEQWQRFGQAFKEQLVGSAGRSLAMYSGQDVRFVETRSDGREDGVTVSTQILRDQAEPLGVAYRLHKVDGESWRIHDVVIDGHSVVAMRAQEVAEQVERGCQGLDDLIERIEQLNAARRSIPGTDWVPGDSWVPGSQWFPGSEWARE